MSGCTPNAANDYSSVSTQGPQKQTQQYIKDGLQRSCYFH